MPPAAGRAPGSRNRPGRRADGRRGLSPFRVACRRVTFVCCLGTGLLLSSTTNAQTTAQPKSETQRILELEKKIFQAARYIEGLHRELQKIKRSEIGRAHV